ncbi:hypothetical protein D9M72_304230 [compost metagenome]
MIPGQQGRGDERHRAADQRGPHLVAERNAGVAHIRREALGEEGAQHRTVGGPDDGKAHHHRRRGNQRRALVEQPEVRQRIDHDRDRAPHKDFLAADPVGQCAKVQHDRHGDQRGDQHHVQRRDALIAQAHQVRNGERGEEKEGAGLHELGANGDQHGAPMPGQRFHQRHPLVFGALGIRPRLCGHLAEGRRLFHLVADPHADQHQHDGQHERNAPAVGQEGFFRKQRAQARGDEVAQRQAEQRAGLRHRAVEAPLFGGRVFHRQQYAAAPFAAQRQPLQQAQQGQQDGRPYADARIGRRKADQHRGNPHDGQRYHQRLFAADAVAHVREDDAAYGTYQERQRERGERQQLAGHGVVRGKEQPAEDDGRHGSVEEIVIPLDGAAHRAAKQRAPAVGRADGGGFRSGVVARRPVARGRGQLCCAHGLVCLVSVRSDIRGEFPA